ncbi:unnamed protein product [Caenorhabditis auriculariae]|uniref:Uncharacterized protein n=1 Tax=Caenorhabditis auriculariae TaxID=2777116 RepID=A0A8S1HFR1_9PELO|nr:unnamed protein product [Caenorhabditis auriculariae]
MRALLFLTLFTSVSCFAFPWATSDEQGTLPLELREKTTPSEVQDLHRITRRHPRRSTPFSPTDRTDEPVEGTPQVALQENRTQETSSQALELKHFTRPHPRRSTSSDDRTDSSDHSRVQRRVTLNPPPVPGSTELPKQANLSGIVSSNRTRSGDNTPAPVTRLPPVTKDGEPYTGQVTVAGEDFKRRTRHYSRRSTDPVETTSAKADPNASTEWHRVQTKPPAVETRNSTGGDAVPTLPSSRNDSNSIVKHRSTPVPSKFVRRTETASLESRTTPGDDEFEGSGHTEQDFHRSTPDRSPPLTGEAQTAAPAGSNDISYSHPSENEQKSTPGGVGIAYSHRPEEVHKRGTDSLELRTTPGDDGDATKKPHHLPTLPPWLKKFTLPHGWTFPHRRTRAPVTEEPSPTDSQ